MIPQQVEFDEGDLIITEDVAATVWLALQLGQPLLISNEDIAKLHHRYTNVYGQ